VLLLQLALTWIILPVCAFAPGFIAVRRLRWSPMEKLCGAVGLSLILVWLAGWAIYLAAPGGWTFGAAGISVICAVLGVLGWRDARSLAASDRVRRSLAGLAFLVVWTLVMLATIRHYSGAGWTGDWLEHFSRTLVYLHHLPAETEVFGGYRIPSRPPMEHVLTALIMAQTQDRFEIYQAVFSFLNLLVFLPCCLMLPLVARPWKSGVYPLTALFALSPVMMVNATYTGSKPLAAFFVVLALAFYLRGWKKNDPVRMSAAFLAAAGGAVAHYSALPYAVFLALHYLIAVFPRRTGRWRELAGIAVAGSVPLLAWFGWCLATFGFRGTFMPAVNTSVGYKYSAEESYLLKSLANLFDAIVPHVVRDWKLVEAWGQPNTLGYIRDNAFLIYQTSLVFTMGLVGGPLVYWLLARAMRKRGGAERTFWAFLIPFSIAACFGLAGERDYFGQAHIILLAMMALGLTLLAGNFTMRRWVSLAVVAGCAVDFSLGVLLHARVEHLENTAGRMPFTRIQLGAAKMDLAPAGPETLARPSGGNWFRKHQYALSEQWLKGLAAAHPDGKGLTPAQETARSELAAIVRQDANMFGGWYKRNGGELTFLGDHFGDSDWTSVILVIGGVGLLWKLARYAPQSAPARPVPARSAAPRTKAGAARRS